MTQPVQEPSQGRVDSGQNWRTHQLFRRPSPAAAASTGMDLGYEYRWGIDDATLGFLAYQDDGTPATNQCMDGASTAVLQGQGAVTPPVPGVSTLSPEGSFISGNSSYRVTDDAVFAGVTEVRLYPTWVQDAQGIGPYIDWPLQEGINNQESMVGSGIVWKASTQEGFPFVCWSSGHSRLRLRMVADGSLITATNPITFEDGDVIQAFWTAFVYNWD